MIERSMKVGEVSDVRAYLRFDFITQLKNADPEGIQNIRAIIDFLDCFGNVANIVHV